MGNFSQYQTSGDTINDALDLAARERDLNYAHHSAPSASVKRGAVQVDITGDGRQIVRDMGRKEGSAATVLPEGMVMTAAGVTTIEAARLAGLLPPGFQDAGKTPTNAAPASVQQQQAPQQQEPSAVPSAGEAAISGLVLNHGADVVETAIFTAAETDSLDHIPEGANPERVQAVVSQFVEQAERDLKVTGASVAMLNETLTEQELRQARMGVIHGDKSALEHFGRVAVDRLASMPHQNPDAFADMIANMPTAERRALTQSEDRSWHVTVRGEKMSFAAAVRKGIVRVG